MRARAPELRRARRAGGGRPCRWACGEVRRRRTPRAGTCRRRGLPRRARGSPSPAPRPAVTPGFATTQAPMMRTPSRTSYSAAATSATAGWPASARLDLQRRDAIAAGVHHVVRPAMEPGVAVLVEGDEVAAHEPVAAEDGSVLLRPAPVAEHQAGIGAVDGEEPGLAGRRLALLRRRREAPRCAGRPEAFPGCRAAPGGRGGSRRRSSIRSCRRPRRVRGRWRFSSRQGPPAAAPRRRRGRAAAVPSRCGRCRPVSGSGGRRRGPPRTASRRCRRSASPRRPHRAGHGRARLWHRWPTGRPRPAESV